MIPPLLLTSSVIPTDLSGKLNDPIARVRHTVESISEWLRINPTIQIVICDGSGFDFTDTVKSNFPLANIECIFFDNDAEQVKKHGKGYGEGEIIHYAIEHSKLMNKSEVFIKCTAKLWVANFDQCLLQLNNQFMCSAYFANVFSYKKTILKFIDTRFYISRKDFYLKHFSAAHTQLGNTVGRSIEDAFLDVIKHEKMKHIFFRTPPVICGVGGGSGKHYKSGVIRVLKDRLRNWIARSTSQYKDLFCD
jgi:hypothetical protein